MFLPSTTFGDVTGDTMSILFNNRYIYLSGEITQEVADSVITQLMVLNAQDPDEDIIMLISSPGGRIDCGLRIYNTMEYISNDIITIGISQCASMASFLLSAGTKGKRFSFKDTEIMLHQPLGGTSGQASDIEIHYKRIQKVKEKMQNYYLTFTNKIDSVDEIEKLMDRDNFLEPEEYLNLGFIDKIIKSQNEVEEYLDSLNKKDGE